MKSYIPDEAVNVWHLTLQFLLIPTQGQKTQTVLMPVTDLSLSLLSGVKCICLAALAQSLPLVLVLRALACEAGCLNWARVIQQISVCSSLQGSSTWQQDDSTDCALSTVLESSTEIRQQSAKIPHSSWEVQCLWRGTLKIQSVR